MSTKKWNLSLTIAEKFCRHILDLRPRRFPFLTPGRLPKGGRVSFLGGGLCGDVFLQRLVGVRPNPPIYAEALRAKALHVQGAQFVDGHVQVAGGLNLVVDPAARARGFEPRDALAQFVDDLLIHDDAPLRAMARRTPYYRFRTARGEKRSPINARFGDSRL